LQQGRWQQQQQQAPSSCCPCTHQSSSCSRS
jgi:hypothetical protein